jgi:phosphoribulokinase
MPKLISKELYETLKKVYGTNRELDKKLKKSRKDNRDYTKLEKEHKVLVIDYDILEKKFIDYVDKQKKKTKSKTRKWLHTYPGE